MRVGAPAAEPISARSPNRALALASVLLVAALVAGCGGSSKPKVTKADFVAKANAVCAAGNARLEKAPHPNTEHPSPAQIAAFVNAAFVPNIQYQINSIRALAPPTGEEAKVTHMLDVAQEGLDKVKANPQSLATPGEHPFGEFASLAHSYGLTQCASNS